MVLIILGGGHVARWHDNDCHIVSSLHPHYTITVRCKVKNIFAIFEII